MNALFSDSTHPSSGRGDIASEASVQDDRSNPEKPAADVFQYEDYRNFLRDRFTELQSRHPGFSQRGLARKAGIANPGFFNEVIKGRRRLSPAAAAKMSLGLDLSREESEYFYSLVEYAETREPGAKLMAGRRMLMLRSQRLMRTLGEPPEASEETAAADQAWIRPPSASP